MSLIEMAQWKSEKKQKKHQLEPRIKSEYCQVCILLVHASF